MKNSSKIGRASNPAGSNATEGASASTRFLPGLVVLCLLLSGGRLVAGTEQGALSSQVLYSPILSGYVDTVNAQIYNNAPSGSDPLNYSIYESTPYGNSATVSGTEAANGGNAYILQQFQFDSSHLSYGNNTIGVTLTDTANHFSITQSATVQVLEHARPAFFLNGNVVQLAPQPQAPLAENPVADPYAFGATGGGEMASAVAPAILGDPLPNTPADSMNLDSITSSGDSEITITLPDFSNLPPDDPSASPSWNIDVATTRTGLFNTEFELNYSDQQNLPGADATGSEHAYFLVTASVTNTNYSIWVTTPEPASLALLAVGGLSVLMLRKRNAV